ncbi:MAG TPA: toxic anion resistance protein [Candidatus Eremiobacteraceae bacterium]|nr:toxic anion resistance protein [Candidatus Eremiobacteraceae bacterium]
MNQDPTTPTTTATPADASAATALVAPAPITPVPPDQAAQMVPVTPEAATKLDSQVADFVQQVITLDINGPDFKNRVDAISSMGDAEVAASAQISNRLLQRPVNTMSHGAFTQSSEISKGLVDLRNTVEDLDPSKQGDLFSPRKLLGIIPFGSKIEAYFESYQSAQTHLNAIINTLYHSKDQLQQDDAAIDQEKATMWALMQKIEQYIYLAKKLDAALTAKIAGIEASDPQRAKVLKEEVLFYTRQKETDLLTQMAVNMQGYMALDLVKRNNVELIKGVDRATTTTVSALRTAVIVAQALGNQKLVLDQITALNTTTGNMIESTSQLLKQQSGQIYEQASSATVSVAQLQSAFDNIYQTLDMISDYKIKALDSMQQTVDSLSTEVAKAKTYLDKTRAGQVAESMATLDTSTDTSGVVKLLPS